MRNFSKMFKVSILGTVLGLIFSISGFAQQIDLELRIDSINAQYEHVSLYYEIINHSNEDLSEGLYFNLIYSLDSDAQDTEDYYIVNNLAPMGLGIRPLMKDTLIYQEPDGLLAGDSLTGGFSYDILPYLLSGSGNLILQTLDINFVILDEVAIPIDIPEYDLNLTADSATINPDTKETTIYFTNNTSSHIAFTEENDYWDFELVSSD